MQNEEYKLRRRNYQIKVEKQYQLHIERAIYSSFEGSRSSGNTNQPRERENNITRMDPKLYKAATEGDIEIFKVSRTDLNVLLTPNKNTVLHIYITALVAEAESPTNFVEEVLKIHPLLLLQANANNEIPLHIAARYGHIAVIEFLLKQANDLIYKDPESGSRLAGEMLRMMNNEKDTALHEAVRYNHVKAVKLLMEKDPEFSYFANVAGETPLYMAAERNFRDIVFEIIDTCKSPAYGGPLGRTALHAAACWDSEEMIKKIQSIEGISKEADLKGWTPFHLAAHNNTESAMLLLEPDRDVAYMKDTEGRTALLIAAHRGHFQLMKKIISNCPDCCELADNRGRNALHFAARGPPWIIDKVHLSDSSDQCKELIRAILNNRSLGNLLNQKDADGNTPLHHLFSSSWFDMDLMSINGRDKGNLLLHPRVDKMAFNNQNLNVYEAALSTSTDSQSSQKRLLLRFNKEDGSSQPPGLRAPDVSDKIFLKTWEESNKLVQEYVKHLKKAAENLLVVAVLITTVSVAAGITMPGGFISADDDKSQQAGSAVLRTNSAFKAFIITDALSFVLSTSAIFIHLYLLLMPKQLPSFAPFFVIAGSFIFLSLILMVLAFITGTYAALAHSLDIAVPTCIIGVSFFPIIFFIYLRISLVYAKYISAVIGVQLWEPGAKSELDKAVKIFLSI